MSSSCADVKPFAARRGINTVYCRRDARVSRQVRHALRDSAGTLRTHTVLKRPRTELGDEHALDFILELLSKASPGTSVLLCELCGLYLFNGAVILCDACLRSDGDR